MVREEKSWELFIRLHVEGVHTRYTSRYMLHFLLHITLPVTLVRMNLAHHLNAVGTFSKVTHWRTCPYVNGLQIFASMNGWLNSTGSWLHNKNQWIHQNCQGLNEMWVLMKDDWLMLCIFFIVDVWWCGVTFLFLLCNVQVLGSVAWEPRYNLALVLETLWVPGHQLSSLQEDLMLVQEEEGLASFRTWLGQAMSWSLDRFLYRQVNDSFLWDPTWRMLSIFFRCVCEGGFGVGHWVQGVELVMHPKQQSCWNVLLGNVIKYGTRILWGIEQWVTYLPCTFFYTTYLPVMGHFRMMVSCNWYSCSVD